MNKDFLIYRDDLEMLIEISIKSLEEINKISLEYDEYTEGNLAKRVLNKKLWNIDYTGYDITGDDYDIESRYYLFGADEKDVLLVTQDLEISKNHKENLENRLFIKKLITTIRDTETKVANDMVSDEEWEKHGYESLDFGIAYEERCSTHQSLNDLCKN